MRNVVNWNMIIDYIRTFNNQIVMSQADIIKEFFVKHPLMDILHSEVADWSVREWKNRTGNTFRHPGMTIRSLYQRGFLIRVRKGVYRYNPDLVINR